MGFGHQNIFIDRLTKKSRLSFETAFYCSLKELF